MAPSPEQEQHEGGTEVGIEYQDLPCENESIGVVLDDPDPGVFEDEDKPKEAKGKVKSKPHFCTSVSPSLLIQTCVQCKG